MCRIGSAAHRAQVSAWVGGAGPVDNDYNELGLCWWLARGMLVGRTMAQGSTAFLQRGLRFPASNPGSRTRVLSLRLVALLTLLTTWSQPRAAFAEAPRWLLEWSSPEGCAGESDLRASVARLLGAPVEEVLHEPLVVRGSVEPNDGSYRLRLLAIGAHGQGERRAEATSCAEVLRMAALLVALAVEPRFGEESPPSSVAPGPVTATFPSLSADEAAPRVAEPGAQTSATAIPTLSATPPPHPNRVEARDTRLPADNARRSSAPPGEANDAPWRVHGQSPVTGAELGLLARLSAGDLPHLAAGAALSGMLEFGRESLSISLGGYLPQTQEVTGEPGGHARFWSGELGLAWRHNLVDGDLTLGPCLGGRAVIVRGDGSGLAEDAGTTSLLLGPTLGASGSLTVAGLLRVIVDAHAHWHPARPRFVVDGERTVFRPSVVGGVFGFGAALDFR